VSPDVLILKGGGVKGFIFAGVVQALEENGYHFSTFVGTSAGAIAAVLLAAGLKGNDLEKELREVDFAKFRDCSLFKALFVNLPLHFWMYPGWRLRQWIDESLKRQFRQDPVYLRDLPLRAVIFACTPHGGVRVFDSIGQRRDEEAGYAVRCSASIPIFFKPESIGGERVFDGGLLNNYPVEEFQKYEQERGNHRTDFIAVYLGTQRQYKPRSVIPDIFDIILNRDDRLVVKKYSEQTISVDPSPIRTTDFSITEDEKTLLVLKGRLAAIEFLAIEAESAAKKAKEESKKQSEMFSEAQAEQQKATRLKEQADKLKMDVAVRYDQVRKHRNQEKKRVFVEYTVILLLLLYLAIPRGRHFQSPGNLISPSFIIHKYHIHVVAVDVQNRAVSDVNITSSVRSQRKRTGNRFEFEISSAALLSTQSVTFYAKRRDFSWEKSAILDAADNQDVRIPLYPLYNPEEHGNRKLSISKFTIKLVDLEGKPVLKTKFSCTTEGIPEEATSVDGKYACWIPVNSTKVRITAIAGCYKFIGEISVAQQQVALNQKIAACIND